MAKFNSQGKIVERTSAIHHSSGEEITNINGLPVQLMGRKLQVQRVRQVKSASVAATTGTEQTLIYPSPGYLGRVKYVGMAVPVVPSASSGDHEACVTVGTDFQFNAEKLTLVTGANGISINIERASQGAVKDIVFDANQPLVITYFNRTNAAQTNPRTLVVIYEEEAIV